MATRAENLHSLINQETMELTNREPMQHRLEPKSVNMCFTWTCFRAAHNTSAAKLVPSLPLMFVSSAAPLWPHSAYLIIRTIQLVFSAGTVFFSRNKSARTVFFSQFNQVSTSRTEREESKQFINKIPLKFPKVFLWHLLTHYIIVSKS